MKRLPKIGGLPRDQRRIGQIQGKGLEGLEIVNYNQKCRLSKFLNQDN